MPSKFDLSNTYPKIVSNNEFVLDLNQGDFRFFNQWMTNQVTQSYSVRVQERNRLDLVSFNTYGTVELWWLIGQFNGIVKFTDVQPGMLLNIPSLTQLESYMQTIRTVKNGQSIAIRQ